MMNNQDEDVDIGKYARHPRRTAGGAFIIGSMIGASLMAAKKMRQKTAMQKFMDRMNH